MALSENPQNATDRLFDDGWRPSDFKFDREVACVFDDMVSRSVPFYNEIQRMQAELAVSLLADGEQRICDLGCSTGTSIVAIGSHPRCHHAVQFVGIDNSSDMLGEAKSKVERCGLADRTELVLDNIDRDIRLEPSNIVLMNWTLQFVRPIYRETLIQRVAEAIRPGGALLISEKILLNDSMLNRLYIEFYYDYKRNQGYSDSEIQNKREALENILIPYRSDENRKLLMDNGFDTVDAYFRWFNFECLVAIKR